MQAGHDILPSKAVTWRHVYQGLQHRFEPRTWNMPPNPWQCSKEVMAEHKYCEWHINRNHHRSRNTVENQTKETPAAASLASPGSQGGNKKARATYELMRGIDSCWTDSLNRLVCTETEF
jgi:hypothetical protein